MADVSSISSHKTTLGQAGRVVIPASMRKDLKLEPHTELFLKEVPGGILITTHDRAVEQAQQLVKKRVGKRKRRASDELIAERRAEARRE